MAKIEFQGLEEYRARLLDLGYSIEGICKYATYDAAGMVADAVKANTPADTGDLRDSIKLYHFRNSDGYIHTGLYFKGYDSKGVPNALKARTIEKGRSNMPARPFIRPAVNRVKQQAEALIALRLDEKMKSIMKEG